MALSITAGDPSSSRWSVAQISRFVRDAWDCEMRVPIEMTSDARQYAIEEELTALENGAPIFQRRRTAKLQRV